MVDVLFQFAATTESDSASLCTKAHHWLRPQLRRRNLVLIRELSYIIACSDYAFLADHILGLPMVGWACRAPAATPRVSAPEKDMDSLSEDLVLHNRRMVAKATSSGDDTLDAVSWTKTLEELESGALVGPFYSQEDIPLDKYRLVPRIPMWEQHAGTTEPSCRNIDNLLARGENATAGSQDSHVPADMNTFAVMTRRATSEHDLAR